MDSHQLSELKAELAKEAVAKDPLSPEALTFLALHRGVPAAWVLEQRNLWLAGKLNEAQLRTLLLAEIERRDPEAQALMTTMDEICAEAKVAPKRGNTVRRGYQRVLAHATKIPTANRAQRRLHAKRTRSRARARSTLRAGRPRAAAAASSRGGDSGDEPPDGSDDEIAARVAAPDRKGAAI